MFKIEGSMKKYIIVTIIIILGLTAVQGEGYEIFKLDANFSSIYTNAIKNNYSVNISTNATLEGKYNINATIKGDYMTQFIDCYFNERKEPISIYVNFRLQPRKPKRVIVKLYQGLLEDCNTRYSSKGAEDTGLNILQLNIQVNLSPLYPFNNNIKIFFKETSRAAEYSTNYANVSQKEENIKINTIRSNF